MNSYDYLDLLPISRVSGTVVLPGSKSISNRALLLAALAQGSTDIRNLLVSDDTQHMLNALKALGIEWQWQNISESEGFCTTASSMIVPGVSGVFPVKAAELFLGNAGTAFRPLTAILAMSGGDYQLLGTPRMYERPIGDLVDALRPLGAQISYLGQIGFPPLSIEPAHIDVSHPICIRSQVSSQFLSSLLMALPLTGYAAKIKVVDELISQPYIEMTLNLMAQFGIHVGHLSWREFDIPGNQYYTSPGTVFIEGDASSASYFLAAGAIAGGTVRVEGVGHQSIQGDKHVAEILEQMGAQIKWEPQAIEASPPLSGKLRALDVDLNAIPDAAMTIAVTALFAKGTTTIRNIASWRVKETDRLRAMATELRKVGADVEEGQDYIRITPPVMLTPHVEMATYDDHRVAMCFSLIALGGVPVRILDPHCTSKTFPHYFKELARITSAY